MKKVIYKVNVVATESGCEFLHGNIVAGRVYGDTVNTGRFSGRAVGGLEFINASFADAVEYVSDCIERTMATIGFGVEFINVEG